MGKPKPLLTASKPVVQTAAKPHRRNFVMRSYVRLLKMIYAKLFRPEQAGRVARYSRFARVASNVIILVGIVMGLLGLGVHHFFKHGFMLSFLTTFIVGVNALAFSSMALMVFNNKEKSPYFLFALTVFAITGWALAPFMLNPHIGQILICWGIATNLAAIGIGMTANNEKIEPRYAVYAELHDRIEQAKLQVSSEEKHQMLHGIGDYWRHHPGLWKMTMIRRLHDTNGFAGTAMSFVLTVAAMAALNLGFVAAMALFIAARSCALVSSGGAFYSHNYRLDQYLKIILDQQQKHINLTGKINLQRSFDATDCVEKALGFLDREHYYTKLLYYRLYMATFHALEKGQLKKVEINSVLESIVKNLKDSEYDKQLSREKLMQVPGHPRERGNVLANMPLWENYIFAKLCQGENTDTLIENATKVANEFSAYDQRLLQSYALHQLAEKPEADLKMTLHKKLDNKTPETVAEELGGERPPHAEGFTPNLHIPRLFTCKN